MTPPADDTLRCPECGAENRAGVTRCWLCGAGERPLEPVASRPFAENPAEAERTPVRYSFTLGSLLMLTTVAAAALSLYRFAPGLSILILVIALPAGLMTAMKLHRQRRQGNPASKGDAVVSFFASSMMVTVFLISLLATCILAAVVGLILLAIFFS